MADGLWKCYSTKTIGQKYLRTLEQTIYSKSTDQIQRVAFISSSILTTRILVHGFRVYLQSIWDGVTHLALEQGMPPAKLNWLYCTSQQTTPLLSLKALQLRLSPTCVAHPYVKYCDPTNMPIKFQCKPWIKTWIWVHKNLLFCFFFFVGSIAAWNFNSWWTDNEDMLEIGIRGIITSSQPPKITLALQSCQQHRSSHPERLREQNIVPTLI